MSLNQIFYLYVELQRQLGKLAHLHKTDRNPHLLSKKTRFCNDGNVLVVNRHHKEHQPIDTLMVFS